MVRDTTQTWTRPARNALGHAVTCVALQSPPQSVHRLVRHLATERQLSANRVSAPSVPAQLEKHIYHAFLRPFLCPSICSLPSSYCSLVQYKYYPMSLSDWESDLTDLSDSEDEDYVERPKAKRGRPPGPTQEYKVRYFGRVLHTLGILRKVPLSRLSIG